ncbi:hypothetical protein [Paenibacillus selenitireducens]|nr:hypothetical protein [Paenibacillus selenitireducens]
MVRSFDMMDDGDMEVTPQFACEACGVEMYPENITRVYMDMHTASAIG